MEVVDIKKILAPNLLIYLYLHCVKSLSWCATTLATLLYMYISGQRSKLRNLWFNSFLTNTESDSVRKRRGKKEHLLISKCDGLSKKAFRSKTLAVEFEVHTRNSDRLIDRQTERQTFLPSDTLHIATLLPFTFWHTLQY